MANDIFSPYIPSWKSTKSDKTYGENVQINPQAAYFRSQSRAKINSFLSGAAILIALFAVIFGSNMLINKETKYNVNANVEGKQIAYGIVGSINHTGSSFSLLFERSSDPMLSGVDKIRFQVNVPDAAIIKGGLKNTIPICYKVSNLTDITKAIATHCNEVIKEGSHVAVLYSGFDKDYGILAAKAVVGVSN